MAANNQQLLTKVTQANVAITGDAPAVAQKRTLNTIFESRKQQFAEALEGSGMSVDRFMRIMVTEVAGSEPLKRIAINNPASMLGACLEMAQLGLDPSIPNEVFLIPYGNEANCQTGYKGLKKLAEEHARATGNPFKLLRAVSVHANDVYEVMEGDRVEVIHKRPKMGQDRGPLIGFYAIARDSADKVDFREMSVEEVQKHKARFSRAKGGPFADPENFEAYGLKTILRMLCSRDLSMGPKLARAVASLEAAESGDKVKVIPIKDAPVIDLEEDEKKEEESSPDQRDPGKDNSDS